MIFDNFANFTNFVVKKIRDPYFDENPSYGPVYKMPRLGKNCKTIGVYKFRTMHPDATDVDTLIEAGFGGVAKK